MSSFFKEDTISSKNVYELVIQLKSIQWKSLNVITFGQIQTDNINQMIIIKNSSHPLITAFSNIQEIKKL
jgi:hypothetical protein